MLWGLSGKPAPLNDPDDMIIKVALIENGDVDPEDLSGIVKKLVGASLEASAGQDRAARVARLIGDIGPALRAPDDRGSGPRELRFTLEEIAQAKSGLLVTRSLVFGGDGGRYTATFGARNAIALRSNNLPAHFLRHRNALGEIGGIASDVDRGDATFRLVPGLANGGMVSLEAVNLPNHFLRHHNFDLKLHARGGDQNFRDDATFRMASGLADPSGVSFESRNFPGHFLRHSNFRIRLHPSDGSQLFLCDATFHILDGLV
jgi:hypothetical protein